MLTRKEVRDIRKLIASDYGINFKTSFFEKDFHEIALIEQFRQICGFSGNNNDGKSKARQFYDYLCSGELPF